MTTTIRIPARLLIALVTIAALAAVTLVTATVAFATPDTKTMTWFLPQGVDPGDSSTGSIWPQTVADPGCAWAQVDTYRYATQEQRAIVDHLADDGLLTLVNGHPEDSAVYLSHFYRPPAAGCGPSSSTTTSVPTTSTTTPTETETTTSWPSTSTTTSTTVPPSTTSSTSTTPSQSTTSSTTSQTSSSTSTSSTSSPPAHQTTSTPPSSTSSTSSSSTSAATPPSTASPRPSARPTSVIGKPARGELAFTGSDISTGVVWGIVILAVGLLITGFFVIIGRTGRRTDEDES